MNTQIQLKLNNFITKTDFIWNKIRVLSGKKINFYEEIDSDGLFRTFAQIFSGFVQSYTVVRLVRAWSALQE